MTDDSSQTIASPRKQSPILPWPPLVLLMAAVLIGLFAAYVFAPYPEQVRIKYEYALAPERFWAAAGDLDVYPDIWAGLVTLASTALLHADWLHVIVNSLMLILFGAPVARTFGNGPAAWGLWMVIFLGSVLAGSVFYLAAADASWPYVVGASGGTSGLVAAACLLDQYGMKRKLWSRVFLIDTAVFALVNALLTGLTLWAPGILGIGIAWEAHVGGYIAGALLMASLPVKGFRSPES